MKQIEDFLNDKLQELSAYTQEMKIEQYAKDAKGLSREALEVLKEEGFAGYFIAQPDILKGLVAEVYKLGQKSEKLRTEVGEEASNVYNEYVSVLFDDIFKGE